MKVLAFVTLPFVISAAFWVSPWIGWPTAAVLGLVWIGSLGLIAREAKP